ncbi:histone H1.2-like [Malania oleifera]|uniref:histone H1.2-like n=1 Tax=Malania oleifera TaxID=397392 RepID=UPI0025ADAFBD|nr:histone H1.2-like [Malania oleifera]
MDSSLPLPATTEGHTAHVANPTPSNGPHQSLNHPPYAEMITAAIGALKERNGSSRRAIAKYIESTYPNLPPTHSALLTHHLKRLKNTGLLLMVKHSYKLPRSGPSGPPVPPAPPTAPDDDAAAAAPTSVAAHPSVPKRGPGRPPKPHPQLNINPTLVALGLVDEPPLLKRRPGRPPNPGTGSVGVQPKRRPGRPPKTGAGAMGSVGRPRGRPRKEGGPSVAAGQSRPRGRPPTSVKVRGALGVQRRGRPAKVGGVRKPKKLAGRPVGRPRKNDSEAAQQANHEDLKAKLEHIQSKVRQAVAALKPHFTNESATSAVAALLDLEELAAMDVNAQFKVGESRPPPPPVPNNQEPLL